MRKEIKRVVIYTIGVLLLLVAVVIGGIYYLYFSADMLTPEYIPELTYLRRNRDSRFLL